MTVEDTPPGLRQVAWNNTGTSSTERGLNCRHVALDARRFHSVTRAAARKFRRPIARLLRNFLDFGESRHWGVQSLRLLLASCIASRNRHSRMGLSFGVLLLLCTILKYQLSITHL